MKKITKILLGMLAAGVVLCFGGFAAAGFDVKNMTTGGKFKDSTWESGSQTVENLSVKTNNEDVTILPSEEEGVRIVYSENRRFQYTVGLENGTLRIAPKRLPWYKEVFSIITDIPKITVYVGGMYLTNAFDRVFVETNNGDIRALCELAAKTVELETDNGDITLEKLTADSLSVEVDNGDVTLKNGSVTNRASFSTDNGAVILKNANFGALGVETDNGRVTAEKVTVSAAANFESDNGDIRLNEFGAQKLSVELDNGDLTASLMGARADYTVKIKTYNGDKNVENGGSGARELTVVTDNGDVRITFAND